MIKLEEKFFFNFNCVIFKLASDKDFGQDAFSYLAGSRQLD